MIIQCDHCSAKFRIDDAKLANGAVRVRCAKCKEVFVVESDAPPVETVPTPPVVPPAPAPAQPDFSIDSFGESGDFSFDQVQPSAKSATAVPSPAADEFDWNDSSSSMGTSGATADFDGSSFAAGSITSNASQDSATEPADNDFDFGDINLSASSAGVSPSPPAAPHDDFSIDFGDVSFGEPAASSSVTAGSFTDTSTADFSFDEPPKTEAAPAHDDFLLSFNTDQVDEPKSSAPAATGGESVNFGEFSFGDMAEEEKSGQNTAQEHLPAPEKDFAPTPFMADSDEEPVPASLSSRKKSGSRFPLFLILGAIVLIVVLAGTGVFFVGGPQAFSKVGLGFLVDWYGDKNAEEGNVTIRNSTSSYIVNSSAGELFVVKGEAVNNFKKPRASIQVKVSILAPGGAVLVSKTAFCGNSLSNEQLTSLPLAKIEEAMNNQFGDSLANLGVKPGNAIPFVVVVSAIPKEATDYSVQIVGSTVATQ